jgi:hypothetical protein
LLAQPSGPSREPDGQLESALELADHIAALIELGPKGRHGVVGRQLEVGPGRHADDVPSGRIDENERHPGRLLASEDAARGEPFREQNLPRLGTEDIVADLRREGNRASQPRQADRLIRPLAPGPASKRCPSTVSPGVGRRSE